MLHSTTTYLLLAALAAGCGGEDDCEVRVLEPCPDCASGQVLRGVEGEASFAARDDGGHVGLSCDDDLVWHDREMGIEATTPLGGDPGGSIAVIGEVAFLWVEEDDLYNLVAVDRAGDLRWRGPPEVNAPLPVSAAGESLFLFGLVPAGYLLGETVPIGITVAKVDPADGRLLWYWQAPVGVQSTGFAPLETGGGVVAGVFDGSIDFGSGEVLAGGDGAGFVVELGPDGAPVWARAITAAEPVHITEVATSAGGDIAIAGLRAGEVDLAGGAVVPATGGDAFVALLGPDGVGRWGAGFAHSDTGPSRVIAAGDTVVAAGMIYDPDVDDMFIVAARDGAVTWQAASVSPHDDRLIDLARTADDTVLLALRVSRADLVGGDVTTRLGRIVLEGETTAVLELRP